ncbi:MAG TPA: hypothetical protein VER58_17890 [Thermoanaerobaculia bacterium]|nr:hypothetical protein [Thermoanaerobaculia bacterium]
MKNAKSECLTPLLLLLTLLATAGQKPPIPSIGETIEISLVNLDVLRDLERFCVAADAPPSLTIGKIY